MPAKDNITCPKCNKKNLNSSVLYQHRQMCDRLDTPDELVDLLKSGKYSSASEMAIALNAGVGTILARMRLSSRDVNAVLLMARLRQGRGRVVHAYLKCKSCTVLLDRPDVPKGNDASCGWCLNGE